MLQRLPIVPAQVKAGNAPDNLLNEMRQIVLFITSSKRNYDIYYNDYIIYN